MAASVHARKEPLRAEQTGDRTLGVVFLVFAAFFALWSLWPPQVFVSSFGPTAWMVCDGMAVLAFLFMGLGFALRAGVWLRAMGLAEGLGSIWLSPLLVQQGLQTGQLWISVLGILFAPAGVWGIWLAYRGQYYHRRWKRVVTFDQLVGR
jgi:hypothetical protein